MGDGASILGYFNQYSNGQFSQRGVLGNVALTYNNTRTFNSTADATEANDINPDWVLIFAQVLLGFELLRYLFVVLFDLGIVKWRGAKKESTWRTPQEFFRGQLLRGQYSTSHRVGALSRGNGGNMSGVDEGIDATERLGAGQRLPYSPLVITILGVIIQIASAVDQTNFSFWVITAISVAIMVAEFTKIISRAQIESVVHAFVWVPVIYGICVLSVANRAIAENTNLNKAEGTTETKDSANLPMWAMVIATIVLCFNFVYFFFVLWRRYNVPVSFEGKGVMKQWLNQNSVQRNMEVDPPIPSGTYARPPGFWPFILLVIPFLLMGWHVILTFSDLGRNIETATCSDEHHATKAQREYGQTRATLHVLDVLCRFVWLVMMYIFNNHYGKYVEQVQASTMASDDMPDTAEVSRRAQIASGSLSLGRDGKRMR